MSEETVEDEALEEKLPPCRGGWIKVGRLRTLGDIARECANLYRRAAKGKITSADASRQASILAVMRQCVESSDTEKRLETIEKNLEQAASAATPLRRVV